MTVTTDKPLDNPFWSAVEEFAKPSKWSVAPDAREINVLDAYDRQVHRATYTRDYCWTVPDPETVAFVAKHCGERAFDPMAGTGYWAYLLGQCGVDVVCYDDRPPSGPRKNYYHAGTTTFVPMFEADAVTAAIAHPDRTLILSWPPYGDAIGVNTVRAYQGDRIVYIGEDKGGCCGNNDLFDVLDDEWEFVEAHRPVQWTGMHDYVSVYQRKAAES